MTKTDEELIDWAIKNKRVDILVKHKWSFDLSPGQAEIVRAIAFLEYRKLSISAMTRYGKTQCVAFGLALLLDFGIAAKIACLAPGDEQAGILRQYLSELILNDPELLKKAQINVKGEERIGKEASRKRMTFNTGAEYRVFSGEGEANRLMGFGCDILIRDEACLLNEMAYTKSSRMLGDNPENSVEIELFNPWNRDNNAFDHTLDPNWKVVQIGWKQAVEEGRTTEKFVMQQKKDLKPLEFTVLYESKFPEQAEDSLFSLAWINDAEIQKYPFHDKVKKIIAERKEIYSNRHKMGEAEFRMKTRDIQEELKKYRFIVSCDPAEGGLDDSVMFWGIEYENKYQVVGFYSEPKSDPMKLVGKIINVTCEFVPKGVRGEVNIDRIGIGSGPFSRIKEVLHVEREMKNIKVNGCHFGEAAIQKDIFQNKKAENWCRLADIMQEGLISIPIILDLRKQLVAEKVTRTSSNKKRVVDPDKSPDYGDALVYLTWRDKNALAFGFG